MATVVLLRQLHLFTSSNSKSDLDNILKQVVRLKRPQQMNLPLIDINKVIFTSYHSNGSPQGVITEVTVMCKNADEAIRLPFKLQYNADKRIASSIALSYVRKNAHFAKWIFEDETLHVDLNQCDEVCFSYVWCKFCTLV
jgi:hypothetical protein